VSRGEISEQGVFERSCVGLDSVDHSFLDPHKRRHFLKSFDLGFVYLANHPAKRKITGTLPEANIA
jgi:hypothetical protein